MGAVAPVSSPRSRSLRRQNLSAVCRSRLITAHGFRLRFLRDRSASTAAAFSALPANWKPPRPFNATMRPFASASIADANASLACGSMVSLGPQAGHALGSPWNCRLVGSRYSCVHAVHMLKRAMVVFTRSYGMPVVIEYLVPQLVQFVNA